MGEIARTEVVDKDGLDGLLVVGTIVVVRVGGTITAVVLVVGTIVVVRVGGTITAVVLVVGTIVVVLAGGMITAVLVGGTTIAVVLVVGTIVVVLAGGMITAVLVGGTTIAAVLVVGTIVVVLVGEMIVAVRAGGMITAVVPAVVGPVTDGRMGVRHGTVEVPSTVGVVRISPVRGARANRVVTTIGTDMPEARALAARVMARAVTNGVVAVAATAPTIVENVVDPTGGDVARNNDTVTAAIPGDALSGVPKAVVDPKKGLTGDAMIGHVLAHPVRIGPAVVTVTKPGAGARRVTIPGTGIPCPEDATTDRVRVAPVRTDRISGGPHRRNCQRRSPRYGSTRARPTRFLHRRRDRRTRGAPVGERPRHSTGNNSSRWWAHNGRIA